MSSSSSTLSDSGGGSGSAASQCVAVDFVRVEVDQSCGREATLDEEETFEIQQQVDSSLKEVGTDESVEGMSGASTVVKNVSRVGPSRSSNSTSFISSCTHLPPFTCADDSPKCKTWQDPVPPSSLLSRRVCRWVGIGVPLLMLIPVLIVLLDVLLHRPGMNVHSIDISLRSNEEQQQVFGSAMDSSDSKGSRISIATSFLLHSGPRSVRVALHDSSCNVVLQTEGSVEAHTLMRLRLILPQDSASPQPTALHLPWNTDVTHSTWASTRQGSGAVERAYGGVMDAADMIDASVEFVDFNLPLIRELALRVMPFESDSDDHSPIRDRGEPSKINFDPDSDEAILNGMDVSALQLKCRISANIHVFGINMGKWSVSPDASVPVNAEMKSSLRVISDRLTHWTSTMTGGADATDKYSSETPTNHWQLTPEEQQYVHDAERDCSKLNIAGCLSWALPIVAPLHPTTASDPRASPSSDVNPFDSLRSFQLHTPRMQYDLMLDHRRPSTEKPTSVVDKLLELVPHHARPAARAAAHTFFTQGTMGQQDNTMPSAGTDSSSLDESLMLGMSVVIHPATLQFVSDQPHSTDESRVGVNNRNNTSLPVSSSSSSSSSASNRSATDSSRVLFTVKPLLPASLGGGSSSCAHALSTQPSPGVNDDGSTVGHVAPALGLRILSCPSPVPPVVQQTSAASTSFLPHPIASSNLFHDLMGGEHFLQLAPQSYTDDTDLNNDDALSGQLREVIPRSPLGFNAPEPSPDNTMAYCIGFYFNARKVVGVDACLSLTVLPGEDDVSFHESASVRVSMKDRLLADVTQSLYVSPYNTMNFLAHSSIEWENQPLSTAELQVDAEFTKKHYGSFSVAFTESANHSTTSIRTAPTASRIAATYQGGWTWNELGTAKSPITISKAIESDGWSLMCGVFGGSYWNGELVSNVNAEFNSSVIGKSADVSIQLIESDQVDLQPKNSRLSIDYEVNWSRANSAQYHMRVAGSTWLHSIAKSAAVANWALDTDAHTFSATLQESPNDLAIASASPGDAVPSTTRVYASYGGEWQRLDSEPSFSVVTEGSSYWYGDVVSNGKFQFSFQAYEGAKLTNAQLRFIESKESVLQPETARVLLLYEVGWQMGTARQPSIYAAALNTTTLIEGVQRSYASLNINFDRRVDKVSVALVEAPFPLPVDPSLHPRLEAYYSTSWSFHSDIVTFLVDGQSYWQASLLTAAHGTFNYDGTQQRASPSGMSSAVFLFQESDQLELQPSTARLSFSCGVDWLMDSPYHQVQVDTTTWFQASLLSNATFAWDVDTTQRTFHVSLLESNGVLPLAVDNARINAAYGGEWEWSGGSPASFRLLTQGSSYWRQELMSHAKLQFGFDKDSSDANARSQLQLIESRMAELTPESSRLALDYSIGWTMGVWENPSIYTLEMNTTTWVDSSCLSSARISFNLDKATETATVTLLESATSLAALPSVAMHPSMDPSNARLAAQYSGLYHFTSSNHMLLSLWGQSYWQLELVSNFRFAWSYDAVPAVSDWHKAGLVIQESTSPMVPIDPTTSRLTLDYGINVLLQPSMTVIEVNETTWFMSTLESNAQFTWQLETSNRTFALSLVESNNSSLRLLPSDPQPPTRISANYTGSWMSSSVDSISHDSFSINAMGRTYWWSDLVSNAQFDYEMTQLEDSKRTYAGLRLIESPYYEGTLRLPQSDSESVRFAIDYDLDWQWNTMQQPSLTAIAFNATTLVEGVQHSYAQFNFAFDSTAETVSVALMESPSPMPIQPSDANLAVQYSSSYRFHPQDILLSIRGQSYWQSDLVSNAHFLYSYQLSDAADGSVGSSELQLQESSLLVLDPSSSRVSIDYDANWLMQSRIFNLYVNGSTWLQFSLMSEAIFTWQLDTNANTFNVSLIDSNVPMLPLTPGFSRLAANYSGAWRYPDEGLASNFLLHLQGMTYWDSEITSNAQFDLMYEVSDGGAQVNSRVQLIEAPQLDLHYETARIADRHLLNYQKTDTLYRVALDSNIVWQSSWMSQSALVTSVETSDKTFDLSFMESNTQDPISPSTARIDAQYFGGWTYGEKPSNTGVDPHFNVITKGRTYWKSSLMSNAEVGFSYNSHEEAALANARVHFVESNQNEAGKYPQSLNAETARVAFDYGIGWQTGTIQSPHWYQTVINATTWFDSSCLSNAQLMFTLDQSVKIASLTLLESPSLDPLDPSTARVDVQYFTRYHFDSVAQKYVFTVNGTTHYEQTLRTNSSSSIVYDAHRYGVGIGFIDSLRSPLHVSTARHALGLSFALAGANKQLDQSSLLQSDIPSTSMVPVPSYLSTSAIEDSQPGEITSDHLFSIRRGMWSDEVVSRATADVELSAFAVLGWRQYFHTALSLLVNIEIFDKSMQEVAASATVASKIRGAIAAILEIPVAIGFYLSTPYMNPNTIEVAGVIACKNCNPHFPPVPLVSSSTGIGPTPESSSSSGGHKPEPSHHDAGMSKAEKIELGVGVTAGSLLFIGIGIFIAMQRGFCLCLSNQCRKWRSGNSSSSSGGVQPISGEAISSMPVAESGAHYLRLQY